MEQDFRLGAGHHGDRRRDQEAAGGHGGFAQLHGRFRKQDLQAYHLYNLQNQLKLGVLFLGSTEVLHCLNLQPCHNSTIAPGQSMVQMACRAELSVCQRNWVPYWRYYWYFFM